MTTATDPFFPDFEARSVRVGEDDLFVRLGGPVDGKPLLLVHGYPQTGVMWADVAHRLALSGRFRVIVPDLPGYGESALGAGRSSPERMSKRRMAADMVALMAALGHQQFDIAGHDRGARVAYRLAFDCPEAIDRVAVLDVVPTLEYWEKCASRRFNLGIYHWTFLAQPAPLPERMIAVEPEAYCDSLLNSWCGVKDLSVFAPEALTLYRANMARPEVCQAMCDDYRAGAGVDAEHDAEDRAAGRMIEAPLLALWGGSGIAQRGDSPATVWRRWAKNVTGQAIPCGHFLPEERPDETTEALLAFFG